MTPEEEPSIDWSLTTWKGSRRRQHQDFYALAFRRKLEVIEELGNLAEHFAASRVHTAAQPQQTKQEASSVIREDSPTE